MPTPCQCLWSFILPRSASSWPACCCHASALGGPPAGTVCRLRRGLLRQCHLGPKHHAQGHACLKVRCSHLKPLPHDTSPTVKTATLLLKCLCAHGLALKPASWQIGTYFLHSRRIAFAYRQRLALLCLGEAEGALPGVPAAVHVVQACGPTETVTGLCWVAWTPAADSLAARHAPGRYGLL